MERGIITQEIQTKSKKLLGYVISQEELRFLPYLHYCCINNECLSPGKISGEERRIYQNFREKGFIEGGSSTPIHFSKKFWKIVNEILWLSYANKIK